MMTVCMHAQRTTPRAAHHYTHLHHPMHTNSHDTHPVYHVSAGGRIALTDGNVEGGDAGVASKIRGRAGDRRDTDGEGGARGRNAGDWRRAVHCVSGGGAAVGHSGSGRTRGLLGDFARRRHDRVGGVNCDIAW